MAEDGNATEVLASPMPSTLQYSNLIQRATPSERFQRRFPSSSGGPFTETNNQIRIPLSLSSGLFLDARNSFIEMELAITATGAATVMLDGGIASLVDSIQILSSTGAVIEDIRNHAQLHAILSGMTSVSARRIECAVDGGIIGHAADMAYTINGGTYTFGSSATTVTRTFCFNPLSGFLSSEHLLPIGLLTAGSPITIVLSLGKTNNCLVQESDISACSYQVTQAAYIASCVQLSDSVSESLLQLANSIGGLQVASNTYQHLTTHSFAAGSTTASQMSIQMAARMRSLNMLLFACYDTADSVDKAKHSITNRRRASVSEYSYMLAGKRYPENTIKVSHNNQGPLINEIKRCFGQVNKPLETWYKSGATHDGGDAADGDKDTLTLVPKEDTSSAKFYGSSFFPVDMRVFGNNSGNTENGTNTSTSTSALVLEALIGAKAATQVHVWAQATSIYSFLSDGNVVASV